MKFWADLGSWGCREKNLPTAKSKQLFKVVFSTFCGQNFFLNFSKNMLPYALKNYII